MKPLQENATIAGSAFMAQRSSWAGQRRISEGLSRTKTAVTAQRRPLVFGSILVICWLYYYRPEDFITPLAYIPMAKIVGVFGFVALIAAMLSSSDLDVPREIKLLWLLLVQMTICIPFALWRTQAFSTTYGKYAKSVIAAMLISMSVVTLAQLRRLLWVQLSAVALVTFLSIMTKHYNPDGRLAGIQDSILSNPNDLAINIAISFPICVAFILQAKVFKKLLWAAALAFMVLGVYLTESRSGLLALVISIMICVWQYGIKGKRTHVVVVTIAALVLGLGLALSSTQYRARVESIVLGNIEGSMDKGSREARIKLMELSAMTAITHPVFGVGAGCFPLVDNTWKVAHNAYTEIAAESGMPALILFLMVLAGAFRNVNQVKKSRLYAEDQETRLLTQALWASLAAFLAGSIFASTEYNLYPYLTVGYTCAMLRITRQSSAQSKDRAPSTAMYERKLGMQPVRSR